MKIFLNVRTYIHSITLTLQARSLLPPLDATYATRAELLTSVKAWAAGQGYAIVIARSN